MFGRIQLFAGDVDAILIPDRAVISDQTRKIVFALDADDKVVPKPVVLGPMHEGMRVVLSGLDAERSHRRRRHRQSRRASRA